MRATASEGPPGGNGAMIVTGRKCSAQHPVKPFPRGHDLGARTRKCHMSFGVENPSRLDRHAEIAHIKSEAGQPRDDLGLRHDSGTAARKLAGDALEDVDLPATSPQHNRGQKPAHRAAND